MVIVAPPLLVGAPKVTETWPSEAVTLLRLGAEARLAGVMDTEVADEVAPSPIELTARKTTL